jgi:predicted P-loop ATPase
LRARSPAGHVGFRGDPAAEEVGASSENVGPRTIPRPTSIQWVSVHPNHGAPIASFSNAIEYLSAACGPKLWLNTMSGVVMLDPQALSDPALGRLRDQAERRYGIRFSAETLGEAALVVADGRKRSPVQEYLRSLRWDGVPRLQQLTDTLCAHRPTPLDLAIVRCFAIQAVARAMKPGCKADSVLILHGGQGAFKSMALRAIAGPFFSDGELPENARDQGQLLRLSWIHELAEIDRYIRTRDSSTMKAMITRQEDAYRPPYARAPIIVPRSFVLTGTVNEDGFLTDLTGNRRFWLLTVPDKIDLEWIALHRDAMWAEAFESYQRGEPWWFDPETEQASAKRNASYLVHDDVDDIVAKAIEQKTTTTVIDVCTAILSRGITGSSLDQASIRARSDKSLQTRVGAALKRLGWQQRWQRVQGKPTRLWTPKDPT